MNQKLIQIAIVVNDYDEAINFYTEKLKFILHGWVVVSPGATNSCKLLLAKAATEEQRSRIGNQTGGRVFLFLETDDLMRDYHVYKNNGVEFVREPVEETWGTVAVLKDLYGNLWDLIEPKRN
jgi:catechol 2,3-dioxygenase-like lactoylglutathione lyase family enzyme